MIQSQEARRIQVAGATALICASVLVSACASNGSKRIVSGSTQTYKLGQVGTAMSAAAAGSSSDLERWQARMNRDMRAGPQKPGAGRPRATTSKTGASSVVTAPVTRPRPTDASPAATLATNLVGTSLAEGSASKSIAPEPVLTQRVMLGSALTSPAASMPAPAQTAPILPAWSERLWLLAAAGVLALAALAAWVLRPRRRRRDDLAPVARSGSVPPLAAANDADDAPRGDAPRDDGPRRSRRQEPPPPTVTILAAR